MFITLEGGEGAGKSTQAKRLQAALAEMGWHVILTREPGGCEPAEHIRALLVNGDGERWLPETEALLMMAARFEHVSRTIKPALEAGKTVLCDRFFDSTLMYQGLGRGLSAAWLQMLYRSLFGSLAPHLTLYLDIAPEKGLARAEARGGTEARFESLPLAFHQQVRAGFLALAEQEPQRVVVIDAAKREEEVHDVMMRAIRVHLGAAPMEAA